MTNKDIEEIVERYKKIVELKKKPLSANWVRSVLVEITQHHEAEVEKAKWNIGAWIEEQDFARKEAERSGDANAVWAIQDVIKQINQHLQAPTKTDKQ